jgi:hypothetical protein
MQNTLILLFVLANLGHVSTDIGKIKDANTYFDQATEMAVSALGKKEHPFLKEILSSKRDALLQKKVGTT